MDETGLRPITTPTPAPGASRAHIATAGCLRIPVRACPAAKRKPGLAGLSVGGKQKGAGKRPHPAFRGDQAAFWAALLTADSARPLSVSSVLVSSASVCWRSVTASFRPSCWAQARNVP